MKAKRTGWLASLLLAVTLSAGCFGPMNLSSKLGTWNRGIENRWAAEAVFLPLRIFYVYTVCFLGDILIFNTIEFWGGSNPISPVDPERAAEVKELEAQRNG